MEKFPQVRIKKINRPNALLLFTKHLQNELKASKRPSVAQLAKQNQLAIKSYRNLKKNTILVESELIPMIIPEPKVYLKLV